MFEPDLSVTALLLLRRDAVNTSPCYRVTLQCKDTSAVQTANTAGVMNLRVNCCDLESLQTAQEPTKQLSASEIQNPKLPTKYCKCCNP